MPDTELLERPADDSTDTGEADVATVQVADVVAADLLVEEISIDGMCGVY